MKSIIFEVPDDQAWLAMLRGALLPLIDERNFELAGTITPLESADYWRPIILQFFEEVPMILPGIVLEFAGATLPAGYLFCDGSLVSRATYPALFAAIGSTWGANDGSTNFRLPDKGAKVSMGPLPGAPLNLDLGDTGGEWVHSITIAELPPHTHVQNAHTHVQNPHAHNIFGDLIGAASTLRRNLSVVSGASNVASDVATPSNQNATPTNQNTGSGVAMGLVQPYLVSNFIIKF